MDSLYTYFKKLPALFLTGLFLLYSGCFDDGKKEAAERLTEDLARIDQYLADRGIKAEEVHQDPSGRIRYVVDTLEAAGAKPTLENCITVRYAGRFLEDSAVFTQSARSSYTLAGNLIDGWKIGLQQLHEGDVATVYIPSGLAYGPTGLPLQNIPPDAIVFFRFKIFRVGEKFSPEPSPTGSCK